jgi:hypothetical protein
MRKAYPHAKARQFQKNKQRQLGSFRAAYIEPIECALAKERQVAGLKKGTVSPSGEIPHTGRALDKIGKALDKTKNILANKMFSGAAGRHFTPRSFRA